MKKQMYELIKWKKYINSIEYEEIKTVGIKTYEDDKVLYMASSTINNNPANVCIIFKSNILSRISLVEAVQMDGLIDGVPIDTLKEHLLKGKSIYKARSYFGVSLEKIRMLMTYLKMNGYIKDKIYCPQMKAKIIKWYNKGKPDSFIANHVKMDYSLVRNAVKCLIYFKELKELTATGKSTVRLSEVKRNSSNLKRVSETVNVKAFIKDYPNMTIEQLRKKYCISEQAVKLLVDDLVSKNKIKKHSNPNWKRYKDNPDYLDRYLGLQIDKFIEDYNNNVPYTKMTIKYGVPYSRVQLVAFRLIEDGKLVKRNASIPIPCGFEEDAIYMKIDELCNKYNVDKSLIIKWKNRIYNKSHKLFGKVEDQISTMDESEYIKVYPNMTIRQMMQYFGVGQVAIRRMRNKLVKQGRLNPKRITEAYNEL